MKRSWCRYKKQLELLIVNPHLTIPNISLVTRNAKTALLSQKEQQTEEQHARIKEIIESINSKNDDLYRFSKEEEQTLLDIKERKNTIEEKTERINELKKKKQELQKFRYVLNYKIKELKRDKGPREEKIAKMKE